MTSIDTKQSLLAEARVTYNRDQQQQSAVTGKKANTNPTDADLLANDPTLENAIAAAESSTTSTTVAVGGGGGHGGAAPASAGKAGSADTTDTASSTASVAASSTATTSVDLTA